MTPELGKAMELSERNWKAWKFFTETSATGLTDEEKRDPIVRRIFAIIGRLTEAAKQQEQVRGLAAELDRLFGRRSSP